MIRFFTYPMSSFITIQNTEMSLRPNLFFDILYFLLYFRPLFTARASSHFFTAGHFERLA